MQVKDWVSNGLLLGGSFIVGAILAFKATTLYFYGTLIFIGLVFIVLWTPVRFQGGENSSGTQTLQRIQGWSLPVLVGYLLAGIFKMWMG